MQVSSILALFSPSPHQFGAHSPKLGGRARAPAAPGCRSGCGGERRRRAPEGHGPLEGPRGFFLFPSLLPVPFKFCSCHGFARLRHPHLCRLGSRWLAAPPRGTAPPGQKRGRGLGVLVARGSGVLPGREKRGFNGVEVKGLAAKGWARPGAAFWHQPPRGHPRVPLPAHPLGPAGGLGGTLGTSRSAGFVTGSPWASPSASPRGRAGPGQGWGGGAGAPSLLARRWPRRALGAGVGRTRPVPGWIYFFFSPVAPS